MAKIPPDDILEGLYKLRIRESEKLKTVLELYDLEIHQKKIGPDYHRLKTIEQDPYDLGTKVLDVNTHRHLCSIIWRNVWKGLRHKRIRRP